MTERKRQVTTTDGVTLAVQESGDASLPTIVLVHGYPDDHTVWSGVVRELAHRFHVVTYDVRGAGASGRPRGRSAYRLSQLAADLGTVIDAVSPMEPVHLVAHDWGSIQSWEAVTEPRFADRLASYTSISGPCLDHAASWLRQPHRQPRAVVRQLRDSYYIALFQLPWLPEAAARAGLVDRLVAHSARLGRPDGAPTHTPSSRHDVLDGMQLYRANFLARLLRPRERRTSVPVQVLAPTLDAHVDSEMQRAAPRQWADSLETREIDGNHWVVEQAPELIARQVGEFIDRLDQRATEEPRQQTRSAG